MKKQKKGNPQFIVSDHAKERFAERFESKVNAFVGNVDTAIENELLISRRSFKANSAKEAAKHNGIEVHHYVSTYAVFVVGLDNTVVTVFERDGSNFDNAKAWKKRRIRTEKRIAKLNGEQWSGRSIYRKPPTEKKYIPMTLIRRVAG